MIPLFRSHAFKAIFTLIVCLLLVLSLAPIGLADPSLDDLEIVNIPLLLKYLTFGESRGVLDPSFDGDGWATLNFGSPFQWIYGIALQPDGKIVVAGSAVGDAYPECAMARYNPDGSLDPSFDDDGMLVTDISGDTNSFKDIALQADGKIVAVGWASNGVSNDFALVRYNPDGSLDTSFSGDGIQATDFASSNDAANGVALQPDGKIVVAGSGGSSDIAVARYNPDGSLDSTFDGDGKLLTSVGGIDRGNDVALQPDGKIVVAGYTYADFAVIRYNADGSLDSTFDSDGKLVTDFQGNYDEGYALFLQPDGKIVVSGSANNGTNDDFALARYNPDGSLDTSFDGDGKLMTDLSGNNDIAYAVVRQENGKIVVSGAAHNGTDTDFALARYNLDGSLDSTFGAAGKLVTDFTAEDDNGDSANALALQKDGRITAAGSIGSPVPDVSFDFVVAWYK